MTTLHLTSAAFAAGGTIPQKHTADGADVSPALAWDAVPAETKSLALICDDPDAPRGTWVHWVIWGLPPAVRELAENMPREATLASGAKQGRNDFGRLGYGGPAPPRGPVHRYFFKLFALDHLPEVEPGATKTELERAMKGHVLARGELMGKYGR
jgi:hypothetical protein